MRRTHNSEEKRVLILVEDITNSIKVHYAPCSIGKEKDTFHRTKFQGKKYTWSAWLRFNSRVSLCIIGMNVLIKIKQRGHVWWNGGKQLIRKKRLVYAVITPQLRLLLVLAEAHLYRLVYFLLRVRPCFRCFVNTPTANYLLNGH